MHALMIDTSKRRKWRRPELYMAGNQEGFISSEMREESGAQCIAWVRLITHASIEKGN